MTFEDFVKAHGFYAKIFEPGKWHRCPTANHPHKKNGCYKMSIDNSVGWLKDWTSPGDLYIWKPDNQISKKPVDQSAIRKHTENERRKEIHATLAAREYYKNSDPLKFSHPYLEKKGLSIIGCNRVRVDKYGNMVVPMTFAGKILSIQRIKPDGTKLFWKNAVTSRTFFLIERKNPVITILAEGLATGLTIFQAVHNSQVYVCFSASNMSKVAADIERHGFGCIASDNDHVTAQRIGVNPGLTCAKKAAEILGIGISVPECNGTDWNDFFIERIAELTAQQKLEKKQKNYQQLQQVVNFEIKNHIHKNMVMMQNR